MKWLVLLAALLLGAQLWLNWGAYSGPGLKTIPSGALVSLSRTGGAITAGGGFTRLYRKVEIGHSPGPLRLSQADLPAQLTLNLPGYQELELTLERFPQDQPIRLRPKIPVLVDLGYSLLRGPGYWGLGLAFLSAGYGFWRERHRARLTAQMVKRLAAGELRPGDQVADYRVEKVLGRGGMGSVYLARSATGEAVALKVLRAQSRFLDEARTYQKLRHPNLVFLLDWGEFHGQLYLALEYIQGESLGALLRRGEAPDARQLLRDLLTALVELQRLQIVHRDLKPDNVMLDNGRARLLDFGIAQSGVGESGGLGTPGYSAPEQLRGLPVDSGADLYALGAILYQVLSGRPAFAGNSPAHLMKLQLEGAFEPLPGPLGELCSRLLQPDPARRPSQPQQILQELFT